MWKSHLCILLCILVVAVSDQISCDDVDSKILGDIWQKRQGWYRPRPPEEDRDRNFNEEEYRTEPQGLARNRQLTEPIVLNFVGVLDSVGHKHEGSRGSLLGLEGQPDARPVHQDGSQPQGLLESNMGQLPPLPNRIFPGHPGRPGQQHPRPGDLRGFQNPRPRRDVDESVDSRSGESPGQQNTWPRNLPSSHNTWPGNLESSQNTWPGNLQGFQNPRHEVNNDNLVPAEILVAPTSPNTWPGNLQSFQIPSPGEESKGQQNSQPYNDQQGQLNSGNSDQQYNNPSGFSNDNNSHNGVSMKLRPQSNEEKENENCRQVYDQYTCDNCECAHVYARCNGVKECSDGSDEIECYTKNLATAGLLVLATSSNTWPGNLQFLQTRKPGDEINGQQNSQPNNDQQGQLISGNSDQQYNNPSDFSNDNNSYNGVSMKLKPQSNEEEENENCRYDQYTCDNRECAHVYARCNGVRECSDGSDEIECYTEENSSGQGSSFDRPTAISFGQTTASFTEGCVVPEQPTGGKFELDSCKKPCTVLPGIRVPVGSFLTYRCNEGYSLKGNNVSFCHVDSWYLQPTCVKTCPPLKSNSVDIVCKYHGEIVSCKTAITPETTATLACKHSYKIPVANDPVYRELTCTENGTWDRVLFRCIPECGTSVAHGNILIVNGFTVKLGVFPWHVAIYKEESNKALRGSFTQICAGSLISQDLIISAAHCFYDDTINEVMSPSKYAVAAGKHYRDFDKNEQYEQKTSIKKIEVASRYYGVSGNFAEDIALVRVKDPFTLTTLVRPICMDWDNKYEREQLQKGQIGKVVGWGKTAEGVPSEELQEVSLPFIPYQECVSAVPADFRGYVTADKFCAGYLNGTSLCEGDSGGGFGFQLESLWYLRGVVSVSPISHNSCDNNYYTAFTNVARFRDWIRAAYVTT